MPHAEELSTKDETAQSSPIDDEKIITATKNPRDNKERKEEEPESDPKKPRLEDPEERRVQYYQQIPEKLPGISSLLGIRLSPSSSPTPESKQNTKNNQNTANNNNHNNLPPNNGNNSSNNNITNNNDNINSKGVTTGSISPRVPENNVTLQRQSPTHQGGLGLGMSLSLGLAHPAFTSFSAPQLRQRFPQDDKFGSLADAARSSSLDFTRQNRAMSYGPELSARADTQPNNSTQFVRSSPVNLQSKTRSSPLNNNNHTNNNTNASISGQMSDLGQTSLNNANSSSSSASASLPGSALGLAFANAHQVILPEVQSNYPMLETLHHQQLRALQQLEQEYQRALEHLKQEHQLKVQQQMQKYQEALALFLRLEPPQPERIDSLVNSMSSLSSSPAASSTTTSSQPTQQAPSREQPQQPNAAPPTTGMSGSMNFFKKQGETHRFKLLRQPFETQRKSYKSENRCILPNPLVICPLEMQPQQNALPSNPSASTSSAAPSFTSSPQSPDQNGPPSLSELVGGTVSVRLVSEDGKEMPGLESTIGSLTFHLDSSHCARLALKVVETSGGRPMRLEFTVQYMVKGVIGICMEKIYSDCFTVYSNRDQRKAKKNSLDNTLGNIPTTGSNPAAPTTPGLSNPGSTGTAKDTQTQAMLVNHYLNNINQTNSTIREITANFQQDKKEPDEATNKINNNNPSPTPG